MQRWDLVIGPDIRAPAFANEAERRDAWRLNLDDVMSGINPGHRPDAWWRWESPEPRDRGLEECLQLYRMGALCEDELAELTEMWRQEEEKARDVPFWTISPGHVLTGRDAYMARRAWAGIPEELFPAVPP
jgi:hypothetical protein